MKCENGSLKSKCAFFVALTMCEMNGIELTNYEKLMWRRCTSWLLDLKFLIRVFDNST
jgi:hypothetical protein